jgi:hypothetical protein
MSGRKNNSKYRGRKAQGTPRSSSGAQSSASAPLTMADWRQPAAGNKVEAVQTVGSPVADSAVTSHGSNSDEHSNNGT